MPCRLWLLRVTQVLSTKEKHNMSFLLLGGELDQLQVAAVAVKPCYSCAPAAWPLVDVDEIFGMCRVNRAKETLRYGLPSPNHL